MQCKKYRNETKVVFQKCDMKMLEKLLFTILYETMFLLRLNSTRSLRICLIEITKWVNRLVLIFPDFYWFFSKWHISKLSSFSQSLEIQISWYQFHLRELFSNSVLLKNFKCLLQVYYCMKHSLSEPETFFDQNIIQNKIKKSILWFRKYFYYFTSFTVYHTLPRFRPLKPRDIFARPR